MPVITASATVTGKTGPGLTSTAIGLTNLRELVIDFDGGVISFKTRNGRYIAYDYTQTTALTDTIAALVSTFIAS